MKLKTRRISAVTLILIILTLVSTTLVFAVPQMPHQFYGDVTIDGVAAPNGISVEAKIGGVTYKTTTTLDGKYGHSPLFKLDSDDPDVAGITGGVNGDTIQFYVDGVLATTYTYAIGGSNSLDLEITTDVYELPLYEGWNLIGIPGIPVDPSIEVMLGDLIDYVESVWTFDGETGHWSSYSPGAPSDLTEILDGKGYWIKMTTNIIWEFAMG